MKEDQLAKDLQPELENNSAEQKRTRTLGNVRLRHHDTNKIILIPMPSSDPDDPLNWSRPYKYYVVFLVCLAMTMCNFLAAGPSIALVETAAFFFPEALSLGEDAMAGAIAKCAYFFTATALLQGTGNFIWMPLCNKYGRRPVYIASYTIYLATTLWCAFEKSYTGFLAARITMGFGSGAAESIAPVSIADIFFLHERGTIMAMYNCFLSIGVSGGIVISGLITISHDWRVIYKVAAVLIGLVLLLAFFTFPETAYTRRTASEPGFGTETQLAADNPCRDAGRVEKGHNTDITVSPKNPYLSSLRLFHRQYTDESLVKLALRPLGLICLPTVFWAALVQAATIGFLVAVTSNVALAFQITYDLETWQIGLFFIAAIIGSLFGIPAGGPLGDKIADHFTKKNGGIRDPEMRLPAMILSLIAAPISLVLYGVSIEYKLHWICPTVALSLLNFSVTQGTNIALVYVIDSYRPVAGEVTLAVMGFKSLFGFLLSFYTNPWVSHSGYQKAYGAMAGISAAVLLIWLPLFFFGKDVRHNSWNWPVVSRIHWKDDREVGE